MRLLSILLSLSALAGFGQEQARPGIVRGRLLQITASAVTVTTGSGDSVQCSLDNHTYMERDGQRIFAGALRVNDPLEIVADRKPDVCYARTIRIVAAGLRTIPMRRSSLEYIYPRGNLTFSGVVRRLNSHVLVLRTRDEAEKMVLLRDDTRYLESGAPADFSRLLVNTRVFVRGGRNIENDLEAYQIIWGEIDGPGTSRE